MREEQAEKIHVCYVSFVACLLRVTLWFLFWLYNSHLTAVIVQGCSRDSRPPLVSLWTFFLSSSLFEGKLDPDKKKASGFTFPLYLFFPSHLSHTSSPSACGDSGVKLRWVKPRPVSHTWTNPWHKHCSWRQGFPFDFLSNYQDNCFPCYRGSFF